MDTFESGFDLDTYKLLLDVCGRYQIDPSMSVDAEEYFHDLLTQYEEHNETEGFISWLGERIQEDFIALNERPRWIQGAEWPFKDGKPMIYIGQIDISTSEGEAAEKLFHDDTSFYVFIPRQKGQPQVVVQQY